jgi:hypothetical protein
MNALLMRSVDSVHLTCSGSQLVTTSPQGQASEGVDVAKHGCHIVQEDRLQRSGSAQQTTRGQGLVSLTQEIISNANLALV